jgi:hypothetical protein
LPWSRPVYRLSIAETTCAAIDLAFSGVPRYEFWKSQSRTKVMTTAAPVSAAKLDRPERLEVSELHLNAYANRDQS